MKVLKKTVTEDKAITLDIEVKDVHQYILENGIVSHNSSLSSATTNSIYPIRMLNMLKSNDTDVLSYSAPDSEKLEKYYERAYDIPTRDMKMVYGIVQKWTDQGISADDWKIIAGGNKVESVEILQDFFDSVKYGNKTRYYVNLETAKGIGVNSSEDVQVEEESGCEACSI